MRIRTEAVIACLVFFSTGVAAEDTAQDHTHTTFAPEVAWAINIGGQAYTGIDGVAYDSDTLSTNGKAKRSRTLSTNGKAKRSGTLSTNGKAGHVDGVQGSQTNRVYQTYQEGISHIQYPLPNGTYDITFKFVEPRAIGPGKRIFNLVVEGQQEIANLDLYRAGGRLKAIDRTVPQIEVRDGTLDIFLQAVVGFPILSAIQVRKKSRITKKWLMIWNDEFNTGSGPDTSKWNIDIWPAGKVNSEQQAYTSRNNNVRIENGRLILEAHREKYQRARYTSGRVHSQNKGDFLYGRIEVHARLPKGRGTWPAIWMLPSDPFKYASQCNKGDNWQGNPRCDAWPNSGEIDIMEHVGYDLNRIHSTVHNKAYYWANGKQRHGSIEGGNVSETFHSYALEWAPDRIDAFFNDSLYFSYIREPHKSKHWPSWPYDHPFHLVLNLAIGGDWGAAGGPVDQQIFPARMEVDYVRVYKPADSANHALND